VAIRKALGAPASAAGYAQQGELNASGGPPGSESGYSVALSARGATALVGAPVPYSSAGPGAAYVFTLRGGTWSQTAELTASDKKRGDIFGWSVALSARGTTALIGAPYHNASLGVAYVFAAGRPPL
jgi:FG-GAP repeat